MDQGLRVIGIIQARMGSTRLPGKILAPLAGRPLLQVLVERLRYVPTGPRVDEWWLATTEEAEDELTARWGEALGLRVFRGSTDDVLSRFVGILRQTRADWVVRVTGDDPFMDGSTLAALVAQALRADEEVGMLAEPADARTCPLGYVPQVARARAIVEAEQAIPASQPWHRSHVLTWTAANGRFQAFEPPAAYAARPHWRWTVDTREDFEMAQRAFALLGAEWQSASYSRLCALFDAIPELAALNQDQVQKAVTEG